MKKILTHLTGIVFITAILFAASCKSDKKENVSPDPEPEDKTKVDIYLQDSVINDTMHLFIFDSKKPGVCGVIDDHLVVVKRRYTVKWRKADDNNIDKIIHIRPVGPDTTFFGAYPVVETELSKSLHKLVIPDTAKLDTLIKYEIKFTVKKDVYNIKKDTFIIDPYLKIPPER